jgi:signal transduction histidine kinase
MTSPAATRRHAITAVGAVCLLVLGGLGWATWAALELDRVRADDAWNRTYDELRALAMSRLDSIVAPLLYRESARPYNHFRRYYKPTSPLNAADLTSVDESIVLESPLAVTTQSDWVLLHFQATETEDASAWSSPQVEEGWEVAFPAGTVSASDRHLLAASENWLVALSEHCTPSFLMDELEAAVSRRGEGAEHLVGSARPDSGRGAGEKEEGASGEPADLSRSAAEFVRRGLRLLEMERATKFDVCVPEPVALENLDVEVAGKEPTDRFAACVPVLRSHMIPLWLDLTDDEEPQLAFVRSVAVEGNVYCTLQGVLVDWEALRAELEDSVRDLFPDAAISPVDTSTPVTANMTHTLMQTIPAMLVPGEPSAERPAVLTTGLKTGLAVAWITTVLALAAIAYGTMKYVSLVERRMRFVAAVTHELRTPLTSFQLYTDLLESVPDDDREQRDEYVAMLHQESKRLGRLVENVLAYSQTGASRPTLHWQRTYPGTLLETVHRAMSEHLTASSKELVVEDACGGNVELETDPEFVVQILTNLVENACKYADGSADSRIWLTAQEALDGVVTFEVDDTGPGVPPEDRRGVFQPFRRSSASSPGRIGLGLGLALSSYWAGCLGGRLSLRRSPRNQRRYSCFTLSLPLTARV